MTTVEPTRPRAMPVRRSRRRPDLVRGGAEVVRGALAVDAIVIAGRTADGSRAIVDIAGIGRAKRAAIEAALENVGSEQSAPVMSWQLSRSDDAHLRALADCGFALLVRAVADAGDGHAEVWVLCRTERSVDWELLNVFARHAAVIVAYRRFSAQQAALDREETSGDVLDELVLSANDMRDLTQKLAGLAARLFGATLTGVMIWDEPRRVLEMVPGSFNATDQLAASYQVRVVNAYSNAARVFATGWPYLSNRVPGDAGVLQDYVEAFGIENTLTLPLRVGRTMIGVLHIANKPTDFTIQDLHRANQLASRISSVVELTRTMLRLRQQYSMESVLSRVAVAIASGERIGQILHPAMSALCAATDANVIALIPSRAAPIVARHNAGDFELEADVVTGAAEASSVASLLDEPKGPGDPGRATLYVPVRLDSQRMGTLVALRFHAEPFATDSRNVLERLGSLSALAYASEGYHRQRAELARHAERELIADDLHDEVAQILFVAQMTLDGLLKRDAVTEEAAAAVIRARGLLVRADAAIRSVIDHLAPVRDDDFVHRLAGVVGAVEERYEQPIEIRISEDAAEVARQLAKAPAEALVKVCREAVVNAAKHGGSCRVMVSLDVVAGKRLRLAVVDDGPGLRKAKRTGHGLVSMRRTLERQGGKLALRSGARGGVSVTASIPI